MKRQIVILTVLTALLFCFAPGVGAWAEGELFSCRFADADEGRELLLSNRAYYENLTQEDLNFRLQKTGATPEEMESFAAEQTRNFTEEEKAIIDEAVTAVETVCRERGYTLPATDDVVFIKTTMAEENDAGAYTHGTQIYLGESLLDYGASDQPEAQLTFRSIVAHELFHCLTRCHPDFRAAFSCPLAAPLPARLATRPSFPTICSRHRLHSLRKGIRHFHP